MAKYNIGAVVAEFNYDITQMMLGLAKKKLNPETVKLHR